jgi:hypothetical protein
MWANTQPQATTYYYWECGGTNPKSKLEWTQAAIITIFKESK